MINEYDDEKNIAKKLNYYFNSQIAIHYKLTSGEWGNAIIRSIDSDNQLVHLKEFKKGNIIVFFGDIENMSITAYSLKNEENGK